jgi:hypothetical protein
VERPLQRIQPQPSCVKRRPRSWRWPGLRGCRGPRLLRYEAIHWLVHRVAPHTLQGVLRSLIVVDRWSLHTLRGLHLAALPSRSSLSNEVCPSRSRFNRRPPWPSARLQRNLTTAGDPGGSPSSLGVRHEPPLHRSTARCPLPAPVARDVRRVGTSRTRLVPPSRFLSATAAFSSTLPAGLLHPAPDPGVRDLSGVPWRTRSPK